MKAQRILFLGIMSILLVACMIDKDGSVTAAAPVEIPQPETKYVALTFDDGPRANTTGRLLDGLRERGASATFFLVGEQIKGNEALLRRMKAEGHQIGNHSWDHMKLQGVCASTVKKEVGDTDVAIRSLLGEGTYWVRPPYGLLNQNQRACFSTPLIRWSVDPEDWKIKNTQRVVSSVLKKVKPGDIILLHDFYPTSVDAAFQIIDTLEEQGYEFVTVKELLALYGVEIEAGRIYNKAYCQ